MKVQIVLLILLGCLGHKISAQEYPQKEIDISRLTDELAAFQDEDINYEDLYENYIQLLSNPLDINSASTEDLRLLNILSESQILSFSKYKTENGKLLSIYELQAIPEFDLTTIYKLIPFVRVTDTGTVTDKSLFHRMITEKNNYFIARYERTLEKSIGYQASPGKANNFKGSEDKLYFRFRTSRASDFSFGFTAEKDAGEQFIWNPGNHQYGPDYWSFHGQIQNKKRIKNLIVGDYQMQFGQGLLLGGAFGLGKGSESILTIRKSNAGFLPYTSVNEAGNLRGGAATYSAHKNIYISGFYSDLIRDASVSESGTSFSSMIISGLHRNENEIANRKVIRETNYGSVINYKTNNLDAGVIFHKISFDIPVQKNDLPYNQFSFGGTMNHNAGLFVNYTVNNFNFFMEAGKSFGAGAGIIAGTLASLSAKLDLSVVYRKYDRDFYTFYSNAFSENTTPQNESGIYWGWKYRWNRKYSMTGYMDLFSFPWLKFRTYSPSTGHEWLLRFNYQPSKNIIVFAQVREEAKIRNTSGDNTLYKTEKGSKHNYWINLDYKVHTNIRLRTRAQFSTYEITGNTTHGMALIHDIVYSKEKLDISFRHALFDTEDFDNRQYVYENDVWLAYSLPAYQDIGSRNYIVIGYKLTKNLNIWLRYSRTQYKNKDEIGSGSDKIEGNSKNDIKFQIRIAL